MYGIAWAPDRDPLFETCTNTWKLGFGVIVALIGGKTV
jgi:hypothetical protein